MNKNNKDDVQMGQDIKDMRMFRDWFKKQPETVRLETVGLIHHARAETYINKHRNAQIRRMAFIALKVKRECEQHRSQKHGRRSAVGVVPGVVGKVR